MNRRILRKSLRQYRHVRRMVEGKPFYGILDRSRLFIPMGSKDDNSVDFWYRSIAVTVHNNKGVARLENGFDLWGSSDGSIVKDITENKLKKMIKGGK